MDRHLITGLVLAGGQGSRMGGVDKGLQIHGKQTLAAHALHRLAAQVGPCLISANRNLPIYQAMGAPVCTDEPIDERDDSADSPGSRSELSSGALDSACLSDRPARAERYAGPLAGLLAGLRQARTPWLLSVPCDAPHFPVDLASRLGAAAEAASADIAIAATQAHGERRWQPVFCLAKTSLADSLAAFLARGERKMERWTAQHRRVEVVFDDAAAFLNVNTLAELQGLNETFGGEPPGPIDHR